MTDLMPFWLLCIGSLLVIPISTKLKHTTSLIIGLGVSVYTSYLAITTLLTGVLWTSSLPLLPHEASIVIDQLSAYFILIVNFTSITGLLYAKGYLESYQKNKTKHQFSIHYICYLWLYFSVLLITMVSDGLGFLLVWELMSLTSFLLVIFDVERENILKIGLSYLIQMHVGWLFILFGFLLVGEITGDMSFESLKMAFASPQLSEMFGDYGNLWLFLIFFVGFGIKAGFIPLHTWLPHAHPAAPSHVSGVMSGVMIKMGIYGILRVILQIQSDLLIIGVFILIISIASGIYGVMMAIVQHDLKKLLAYHSIENIGIIGIGIGVGVIGIAVDNPVLATLGLAGGLLHVLNHSLFKSLLFYCAGSVYKITHTREINRLGGLITSMPKTAGFFLLAALAICGLPPLNGFISEFLIYMSMFHSLSGADLNLSILFLIGIVSLALIGGLAIFCFTKAFGMVFLGTSRSVKEENLSEVENSMLLPKYLAGAFIVFIGLFPFLILPAISKVMRLYLPIEPEILSNTLHVTSQISLASITIIGIAALLLIIRSRQQKKVRVAYGATWGCGYTAGNPAKHQYTATSYADSFKKLAGRIVGYTVHYDGIKEDDIFPGEHVFETHAVDKLEDKLVNKSSSWILKIMERFAVLQTGHVQHYLIYPLLFILVIFLLTYLKII